MGHSSGVTAAAVLGLVFSIGCTGDRGPAGATGAMGAAGAMGPTGPAGQDTGTPAVSAVSPATVFLTRGATVTISGSDTSWSPSATVDFGPGVRVVRSIVASPASVVCVLAVDGGARVGPRDVTVRDGGLSQVFRGAFTVLAPGTLEVSGSQAQGSVLLIHVTNQDVQNPFDGTAVTDATGNTTYPNFDVKQRISGDTGTGVAYDVSSVAARSADLLVTLDVNVAPGPQSVTLESGAPGWAIDVPTADGYMVQPRTPAVLTAGRAATGTIARPYDSGLYSFTPRAGLSVIDLGVTATGTGALAANLQILRLPRNGRFADLIEVAATSLYTSAAAVPNYVVAWDNSGSAGYRYTLSATVTAATGVAQAVPAPTSTAAPQALSLAGGPVIVQHATLESANDVRVFALTISGAAVGRRIRVLTEAGPGGDANTDVAVDLLDASGASILPQGRVDDGIFENVLSAPITRSGRYFVQVSAGSAFDPSAQNFQAMVRLE